MSKIGLVLAGGMIKGAYQVGVLKALLESIKIEEFDVVCGASVGVLNGYAAMCDNLSYAQNLWSTIEMQTTHSFIGSMLKSNFLQKHIEEIAIDDGILCNKFIIPLLNVSKKKIEYINLQGKNKGEMIDYLSASIALPGFNEPVVIDGQSYYDGAIIDNIPVFPLKEEELDYIVCVYFDRSNYFFESNEMDEKIIRINFNDENGFKSSMFASNENILKMLDDGYKKAKAICDEIFIKGPHDIEFILSKNQQVQKNIESKKIRITGDVLVANMNKVMKKLIKRNIVS